MTNPFMIFILPQKSQLWSGYRDTWTSEHLLMNSHSFLRRYSFNICLTFAQPPFLLFPLRPHLSSPPPPLPPPAQWAALHTYLPGMWVWWCKGAVKLVATGTQLVASHPNELSESVRVCVCLCVGHFFSFPSFWYVKSDQEVWCCDSREEGRRTMAPCLCPGLVAWEAPRWRVRFFFCSFWSCWMLGQVSFNESFS